MKILDLGDLREDLKDVRAALVRMILDRDAGRLEESRAVLQRLSASIDERFDALLAGGGPLSERLRPSVLEARDIWEAFRKTRDEEIIPALMEGRFGRASSIAMGIQEERYRQFTSIVDLVECGQNLEIKVAEKTRAERENFFSFIRLFVDIMELFDPSTGGHSRRVAGLVRRLAVKMGLSGNDLDLVAASAYLHAIGLIAIPRDVLEKEEGELNDVERKMLYGYPQIGQGLLSSMETLKQAGVVIRSQLERYDGLGHPDGLRGEEIHIGARILAVCKAYDRARKRKKSPCTHREALNELKRMSGAALDPMVVAEFISLEEGGEERDAFRVLHVWELEPGRVLVDRLVTSRGRLLLAGGTRITDEILQMIKNYHSLDPIVTLARVRCHGHEEPLVAG